MELDADLDSNPAYKVCGFETTVIKNYFKFFFFFLLHLAYKKKINYSYSCSILFFVEVMMKTLMYFLCSVRV